jgi:hypothetical protein
LRLGQEARQNIGDPVGLSLPGFPLRDDQQAAAVDGLADGSFVHCVSIHGGCSSLLNLDHRAPGYVAIDGYNSIYSELLS